MLRLRLSDGVNFAVELTATDPVSLRTAVARAWTCVPAPPGLGLHLHVHTLDPALGDEWYWVDMAETPRMAAGIRLRPGWLTPEEAATVWEAAVRTERMVSDHARNLRVLAATGRDLVED